MPGTNLTPQEFSDLNPTFKDVGLDLKRKRLAMLGLEPDDEIITSIQEIWSGGEVGKGDLTLEATGVRVMRNGVCIGNHLPLTEPA